MDSLREGGCVAQKLSSYEPRQAQLDLLELIIKSFNEDALLTAEAGTGVGKSFAYLIPAMHFALERKEKVAVSTATITLQQQLYEKDIPLVASATGLKIKAVIMKGRGNYLCLRRLDDAIKEPPFLEGFDSNEINLVAQWAEKTKTGERSELTFLPSENIWSNVCSESDLCLGYNCPWKETCFILKMRKEANNADIIIVNHHLLFADLAARYQGAGYENAVVLPPFTRLILDEAHTIENAATSFFSAEFARTGIFRQLGRLYQKRRANKRGLLIRLCSILSPGDGQIDSLADALQKVRVCAEELDDFALQLCGAEGLYRLSPCADEDYLKKNLFPYFIDLRKKILSLTGMIREITENLDDEASSFPFVWEIKSIVKRLEGTAEICDSFCKYKKHENEVLWIEKQKVSSNPWAVFTKAPLDLSVILKDSVFLPNKTVVCLSATLAVNEDFSYWASRCGIGEINDRPIYSGCFPSPFPYSEAVLLACPADAPLPDEQGWQEYVNDAVTRLASISEGSALILFTSYQSLSSAYNAAKNELTSLGIRCLKQGDDDRSRLLQIFISDTKSCLFATDSFWEGIDAPGETLRLVIICRLPFHTPGDPVYEARCENIKKQGGSSFMELSLPQAVIKFKQGFGRLMRRCADNGVVAVLDSRLHKKNYGKIFIASLPETKKSFCSINNILKDIENFLY